NACDGLLARMARRRHRRAGSAVPAGRLWRACRLARADRAFRSIMKLLRLEKISKSFGGVQAARDVSFDVAAGEMVALIGPNGAGKSTIFNIIGGQIRCDRGRVLLAGEDVAGLSPRALLHRGVGRTFQVAQSF